MIGELASTSACVKFLRTQAGSFDQVGCPNLASCERIARRIQAVEYFDGDRGGSAMAGHSGGVMMTDDEVDIFEGRAHTGSSVCCDPSMIEHVSKELEKEAAIQKQARKAREEKGLTRAPPPEPEGKGGGGMTQ